MYVEGAFSCSGSPIPASYVRSTIFWYKPG